MRELKKGSLGLLLLHLLQRKPSYGYELCEQLRSESEGTLSFEDGAIYPLLHDFERQGFVEAFWEENNNTSAPATLSRRGPRRRYYRLTPEGLIAFQAAIEEWRIFSKAVTNMVDKSS
jgi:PadR family transcriptional regulator PadR